MNDFSLWMGTEQCLLALMQSLRSPQDSRPAEPQSPILQIVDSVAVVDIHGPLLTRGYSGYYGSVTGYDDIRNAVIEAASTEGVQDIVLNIDTGGGSAAGIADVSSILREVGKTVPITTYNSGSMYSAGYWIGASASKVYAGQTSGTGSIGVIRVHQDMRKMLADMGIEMTVMRAGDKKALLNPFEELTPAIKSAEEKRLEQMRGMFAAHVAMSRSMDMNHVLDNIATGEEFTAPDALKLGLIDGIMSFDSLVNRLRTEGRQRAQASSIYGMESNMAKPKKFLDEATQAKLSLGVPLEEALASAPEAPETDEVPVEEPVAQVAEPVAEAPTASAPSDLTLYLQAELAAKSMQVVELQVELREAQSKLGHMSSLQTQFDEIVRDSATRMHIGMGGSAPDFSMLSGESLLAQFNSTRNKFNAMYPVGGKAALPSTEEAQGSVVRPASNKLRAVRISK